MDPESPIARVERTLWTVWYYITGAVNRFFRPSPADTVNNDPNSFQESTEHRDPQEEDDSAGRALSEEQALAKASQHSSPCSIVASNLYTVDIRPNDESTECKTRLSGGSEDGKGTREEQPDLTGNDDTRPLAAEDDTAKEQETTEVLTLYTCRQDEKNEGRHVSTNDKSDDMDKSEGETGTEEEEEEVSTEVLDNVPKMDETMSEGQEEDEMQHEDEQCVSEEDSDVTEKPEERDRIHRGETGDQIDDAGREVTEEDTDVVLCENETEEVEKQPDMSEDEPVVTGQEHLMACRSESTDKDEQGRVTEEEERSDAANNQQTKQEKDMRREKNMLTECVTRSEEGVQNAEQEDVAVTEIQNETNSSLDLSIELETFPNEESFPETLCSTTSVTVTLETGQEIREFKNISLGTSEGHVVMLKEVNTPTCEETQEGVPEYNNELRPDENMTQKILEVGDCEEIQAIQLPEEEEEETVEKGGCGTDTDSMLVRESMEDNQENITGDIEKNFEETEKESVGKTSQESGHVSEEEEEGEENSMKTEFQTTEELLVGFGTHEALYDTKDVDEEVCDLKEEEEKIQKMPEKNFFDEPGQAMATEKINIRTPTFEGDMTDSGFLKHSDETEHELLDEMQEAPFSEENEKQKKIEQVDSEVSLLHFETQDDQSPGMSEKEMMKDTEAADESNTSQSVIERVTETEVNPGHRDVIDEEILDLWIETALSEDDIRQQEGPEQMETEPSPVPSYEEPDEGSPKKEKEPHSDESALVSDTEISTAETEFLDQSLGECGTQNSNEVHLLKPICSLKGINDMSESAAQQPNSESQVDLMEGREETDQSYLKEEPDSGVSSPLHEESDNSQSGLQKDVEVTDMEGKAEEADFRSLEENKVCDELLVSDFSEEITHTEFSSDSIEKEIISNEGSSQSDMWTEKKLDGSQPGWLEEDLNEVDAHLLDFTVQKSRIAVKNPLVRPPKDPRSLLHMPSADPTPSPQAPVRTPAGVPIGGMGMGIKLPGFGAGFPVLKKTKVERDVKNEDPVSQETEKKTEKTSEAPNQDEVPQKPKWMPPRQPGFGNPLMSELKTKLKKTTKE